MAKDDYYTIVTKILVYLYNRLKGKTGVKPENYLIPLTEDFPINEEYFDYVMRHMIKQGLIEGLRIRDIEGKALITGSMENVAITPAGIDFMIDNSKVRKIAAAIPQAAAIMSLFDML